MVILPRQVAHAQDRARATLAHLRTYIELGRHVLAEKLDGMYRLWLLARALDRDGRGLVGLPDFLAAMSANGLNRSHLRRACKHPKSSAFFTLHANRIEYRSLEAVCLALGVMPGRSIYIPLASITGIETFRATLYAAWIAGHDALQISRDKLSELFQASADTQRRWEKLAGVTVAANIVEITPGEERAAAPHIPKDMRLDDRLGRSYTWTYQGKTYYRTVNRYQASRLERAPLGNVRKVTRKLHAAKPDVDHGVGTRRRVFFTARTIPSNYQEMPGASIRDRRKTVDLPQGASSVWRFHPWRPTTRRIALC